MLDKAASLANPSVRKQLHPQAPCASFVVLTACSAVLSLFADARVLCLCLTGDEPLGDDMYYEQKFSGEIPQIWYQEGDDPYFVNVKVCVAIAHCNAFECRVN